MTGTSDANPNLLRSVAVAVAPFLLGLSSAAAPRAAAGGMATARLSPEVDAEARLLRFDLGALPRATRVFRADLYVGRAATVTGADEAALESIEIRPLAADARKPAGEPLVLRAPWRDRFDATEVVSRWIAQGAEAGFVVRRCALWDPRSSYLEIAYEGVPRDVPPQVSGLRVLHRAGQTFLSWKEVESLISSESPTWGEIRRLLAERTGRIAYRIYAHTVPIRADNLHEAERLADVDALSAYNTSSRNMEYLIGQAMIEPDEIGELARDYNGYMYTWGMDSSRMDRYPVPRFVIDEDAGPLPAGRGLYVHHPRDEGERYYCVVSCRDGVENTREFSTANSLAAPVEETVGPGEPIRQGPGLWGPYFDYPGRRQVYVQWCAPPLAPRPNMYFNWSVLVPPGLEEGQRAPVELALHSGNFSYAKPRKKYILGSIQIAPHDYPFSGWYGYNDAYGTLGSWRDGVVRNHTQRRIFAFLKWARGVFPLDPDRTLLSGADGAALLALSSRKFFSYALIAGFEGSGKEYGRLLDPSSAKLFASAWGPRRPDIRDDHGRGDWGWASLDRLALERPGESTPLLICAGGSWGGVRGYGKAFGRFYARLEEARQPLIAGFGWDTKLITPDWYSGLWQPRRNLAAPALDLTRATPIPALANSSRSVEKLQSGNINWMHFWWDLRDEPDAFQIALGGRGTVDVTPRRLRRFKPQPAERLRWRAEPLPTRKPGERPPPRSGRLTVDSHGLFTVKGLEIPEGGVTLRVARPGG